MNDSNYLTTTICKDHGTVEDMRRSNAATPINNLPPEILELIFSLVPWQYQPLKHFAIHVHSRPWLKEVLPIMSTCHHWRQVASGCLSFWSAVDTTFTRSLFPSFADLYRGSPLVVSLDEGYDEKTLAFLSCHSDKITELSISYIPSEVFSALASGPLAALEHCAVAGVVGYSPQWSRSNLLKTLSLCRCDFLPATSIPSLTHLAICGSMVDLGPDTVLRFISGCKNLETLCYHEIGLFDIHAHTTTWTEPIVLERLERFVLQMEYFGGYPDEICHLFYAYLKVPSPCVVEIGQLPFSDLTLCMEFVGLKRCAQTWHLLLTTDYPLCLCIRIFNRDEGKYLGLSPGSTTEESLSLLNPEIAAMLSQVRELWLSPWTSYYFDLPTALDLRFPFLFPHLAGLETLVFCRTPRRGTPEELAESRIMQELHVRKSASGAETVSCPSLKTLRVDVFSDAEEHHLLHIARSRADAGHPLSRLIVGCWPVDRPRDVVKDEWYVLREYDGHGNLVRVGDALSDGLKAHWMSQLSNVCLDEIECAPYSGWYTWDWEGAR